MVFTCSPLKSINLIRFECDAYVCFSRISSVQIKIGFVFLQLEPKTDVLLRHNLDQETGALVGNPLVPCSSSLNSTANSSPVVSSGFAPGPGSRDHHVLPDLLPPQIPPRNALAARRTHDRPLSDEVTPPHAVRRSLMRLRLITDIVLKYCAVSADRRRHCVCRCRSTDAAVVYTNA